MKLYCSKNTVRKYYKYVVPVTGYRQLTHLSSSGSQFINTGLKGFHYFDMKFRALTTQSVSERTGFFGARQNSDSYRFGCLNYNGIFHFMNGNGSIWNIPIDTEWHTLSLRQGVFIDNSTSYTWNMSTYPDRDFYLFAENDAVQGLIYSASEFGNCTFYNTDMTTAKELVPVERISDGVLGFYDKTNDEFLINQGSSSFTKGDYLYEESTEADYDFYEDVEVWLMPANTVRKYYKYVYEPFTQPTLTSSGIMGGDSFAVAQSSSYGGYDFWHVFNDLQWHSGAGLPQWVSWYNPIPLKISKLSFVGHSAGNIKDFIVQGSNNNSNWTDILSVSNTTSTGNFEVEIPNLVNIYKYWRLYITSCYYYAGGNPYPLISSGFQISATEQHIVTATQADYDFYKDVTKYTASIQGR